MGKKVLVIDDDLVSGVLMKSRLTKAGYEVSRAINGEQGLNAVQADPPALIILDVEMPEMNGYTFVVEIQKFNKFKDIPVIVLTAHEENRKIFARKGISNYLLKPVDFDVLLGLMEKLLARV
ncbi:MAG: response regulator [Candidatus Omnitrophica bacterium]|nr:response regulator [Candidatus Omnitrophota bacterium]